MNYSKLSYDQIISLANSLQASAQNMQQVLGEVTNLLNRIGTADIWAGTAATAARSRFDMLSAKFPEFYEATSKCQTHLISVVENYKNVDASISNV